MKPSTKLTATRTKSRRKILTPGAASGVAGAFFLFGQIYHNRIRLPFLPFLGLLVVDRPCSSRDHRKLGWSQLPTWRVLE